MLPILNSIFSVLAALSLSYVVLHPRIREGLWIKGGLIFMIIALLASAAGMFAEVPTRAAFNAGLVLRIGIVIVCIGYGRKYRKAKQAGEATDFGSLTER